MKQHPLYQFGFCPKCGSERFEIRNIKAKRCAACGFVYYFNPSTACVAVIMNERNELLVATRAHDPAMGTLDLPGGFVDMDETLEQAVAREVNEETGLRVVESRFLFSLPNRYLYSDFEVQTVDCFFFCRVSDPDRFKANDDVCDLRWIGPDDLKPEEFGLDSIREGIKRISGLRFRIPD